MLPPGTFGPYDTPSTGLGSPTQADLMRQYQNCVANLNNLGCAGCAEKQKPPVNLEKLESLKKSSPRMALRPTPDFVVPLVGWRAWNVVEGKLTGIGVSAFWEPKKIMEAECHGSASMQGFGAFGIKAPTHKSPHMKCGCGIWSFSSMEKLLIALDGYGEQTIIGQVSIWGRVIECENGFRSQFAYPKELWLLDESMEQLGYIYGVPIRTAA